MKEIITFLMFVGDKHGKAEEAINFYVSLFPDSSIDSIERYGPDEQEHQGTVKVATFTINAQKFMAIDSAAAHKFTFTPAISLYAACESKEEVVKFYDELSAGGQILMPLDDYGFSPQFGWVNDRFGVSWQINLIS